MFKKLLFFSAVSLAFAACSDDHAALTDDTDRPGTGSALPERLYVLCEGLMGANQASIDYYDFSIGSYLRNAYVEANPNVVLELGDVGNDLQCYGGSIWAVINGSNKVEVMDASTLIRRGQVDIPNCRCVAFDGGYAYVTSYAGPVNDADGSQRGYVAKVDTATLTVVDTLHVGRQPEGLAVADGKLYVANSGGYCMPAYENTLSVIDLADFRRRTTLPVAVNMQRIVVDRQGMLWVNATGNYADVAPSLCRVNPQTGDVTTFDIPVGSMTLQGDSLYIVSNEWDFVLNHGVPASAIVDVQRGEVVSRQLVDATVLEQMVPYSVAVHPRTHEIFISDAGDYVSPGTLYCFGRDGSLAWKVRTGHIPGHLLLVGEE